MIKISDNFSKLEIKQMKSIDNLQEKIKLMEFDKMASNNIIRDLKLKLKIRDNTLKSAIYELEEIEKNEDYKKIDNVLFSLKSSLRRQDDIEKCSLYDEIRTRN